MVLMKVKSMSLNPVERVIMGDTVYASRFIGPLYAAGFEQVISAQIGYKDAGGLADLISVPINIAPSYRVMISQLSGRGLPCTS